MNEFKKIKKPITNKERATIISEYNHKLGYTIEETENEIIIYSPDDNDIKESRKEKVRLLRNALLKLTDIYILEDYPIDEELRQEYKNYRTYLRNYTEKENWWDCQPYTFEEWKLSLLSEVQEEPDVPTNSAE